MMKLTDKQCKYCNRPVCQCMVDRIMGREVTGQPLDNIYVLPFILSA